MTDNFDFSDPDFDDLPANTLLQIESNAIRATQHQPAAPESDYGLDDGDEVVNLDDGPPRAFEAAPQYTQGRQDYAYADHYAQAGNALYQDDMDVEEPPRQSQADPGALLSRIKKLEQDKAREKREADELKGKLQTKAGEADTLRRRHDADIRRHERDMADQQQSHSAELAKMRAEIERLRRDKEQAQTDNMFIQHDAREAGMAPRTRRAMPSRPKPTAMAATSPAGTPKRVQKTRGSLGDGFEDDDVIMASPSKARDRLKTATPKQAAKRKRQAIDNSPVPLPALQLSEPRSRPTEKEPEPLVELGIDGALLQHFRHDDRRFTLLHRLLSHPASSGDDRILEALTQHAFPTQPSKRLSSIVYDALATAHTPDVHNLALRISSIFLDLWQRCLDERYYGPTSLILDAMHFILACEPAESAVKIAERAVPLIIAAVDLVSLPVLNAAKLGGKAVASLHTPAQRDLASKIDVVDCLGLLYVIATSCISSVDPENSVRLWKAIPSGVPLMLLNKEYPGPQITLMLRILSTSALASSLGPIAAEDESQANIEDALVSRLTNMFIETPKSILDPVALADTPVVVSEADLWELRLLVLMVLTQFSTPEHGSVRLAQNRLCIGRLIKYLDYSITSLYRQPLSPTQDLKIGSVNATMKLIYHIASCNPGFDIKSKLVNTLGGHHAYLVALTRLAFSEGLVLEAGIEDAVVNMAHDILDENLSMEEGAAYGMVFSSGSSV